MSSIFGKNLKYLREKNNLEQVELAHLLGRKSGSSVSEWEKGTYEPKAGTLADISRIFNVPLQDLMSKDLTVATSNIIPVQPNFVKIPILGTIACGNPITAIENHDGYRYEPQEMLPSGNLFYLKTKGDSMEPTIPDNAYVLIREQPDVEYGEIAAVLVNGDTEMTLKRVKKQGDSILLMPDNPKRDPILIDENNPARIIGKAIRYTQDL